MPLEGVGSGIITAAERGDCPATKVQRYRSADRSTQDQW